MLHVKSYNCVNGNAKVHSFRAFKSFSNTEELEVERVRLKKKYHADTVDFVRILDTGEIELSEQQVKEIISGKE